MGGESRYNSEPPSIPPVASRGDFPGAPILSGSSCDRGGEEMVCGTYHLDVYPAPGLAFQNRCRAALDIIFRSRRIARMLPLRCVGMAHDDEDRLTSRVFVT